MIDQLLSWQVILVLLVTAVALFELVRAAGGRWLRTFRARRRSRRARAGEIAAEQLLERRGFTLVERQPRRELILEVDGREQRIELRADLIVARGRRRLVAEVKTGARAPRIETGATRRQLLEYLVAYQEVDGVLLVDVEAGRVREVVFPVHRRRRRLGSALVGAAIGGGVTWLVLSLS